MVEMNNKVKEGILETETKHETEVDIPLEEETKQLQPRQMQQPTEGIPLGLKIKTPDF